MPYDVFSQDIESYGRWMRLQGKSEATVGNNMGYCRSFVRFCAGNINGFQLASVTDATLIAFAEHMKAKGFRRSTVSSEVGGALSWCRWLISQNKLAANQVSPSLRAGQIVDSVMGSARARW